MKDIVSSSSGCLKHWGDSTLCEEGKFYLLRKQGLLQHKGSLKEKSPFVAFSFWRGDHVVHFLLLWLKQVEPLLVPKKVLCVAWCCPRGAFPIPHCPHIVRHQSVAQVISCPDCICGRRVRPRRWSSNSSISKKKDSAKACCYFSSLTISSLFPYFLYKFILPKLKVVRASDTKRNMEEVDIH